MSIQTEKIKELVAKREQARLGGGQKAIDKQHAACRQGFFRGIRHVQASPLSQLRHGEEAVPR